MADTATQQSSALQGVTYAGGDFASLLQKEFKPRSDEAKSAVEAAVQTLAQAEDAISLRDVAIGQPIQLSMVRQSWRVKAGQKVMVIAQGDGFSINSEGQALNNAAVAQNARVRMSSGQVVSGTVDSDGNILINL